MSTTQENITLLQRWKVLPRRARYFLYLQVRRALDRLAPSPSHPGVALSPGRVEQWKESLRAWRPFLELAAVPLDQGRLLERARRAAGWHLTLLGAEWAPPQDAVMSGPAWRTDPVSGHQWPRDQWYRDTPHGLPPGVDIKAPWELSRCYHFLTLGLAYRLGGQEELAQEFGRQLRDWISQNPLRCGPNWANAMEAGIRAANWLTAALCFLDSPSLGHDFWATLLGSVWQHGRFILANRENLSPSTSNHYLANLAGLYFVGCLCPPPGGGSVWRDLAQAELEKELPRQTYPDGWDFEASTAYHRLVSELLLYPYLLGRCGKRPFSRAHSKRLRAMLRVMADIQKPDGSIPQIGDNDSGRFLVFNGDQPPAALEVGYLLHTAAAAGLAVAPPGGSVAHTSAGRYLLRGPGIYLLLAAGPKGQAGNGGHAHNDVMSLELNLDGQDLVVDPGTYTYTRDPKARNDFRSVARHNTLCWPGLEPCGLEQGLFCLREQGRLEVLSCGLEDGEPHWAGRYEYQGRFHQREVRLSPGGEAAYLRDACSHPGARLNFCCAPGLRPIVGGEGFRLGPAVFRFQGAGLVEIAPSHYSPAYGERQDSFDVSVALRGLECSCVIEAISRTQSDGVA